MTPAARVQTNIQLLETLDKSRVPMDLTLGDFMRFRKYIGSKDRAEIVERCYNIARARARIEWWLEHKKITNDSRLTIILWLVLGEKCSLERLHQLFDGSKYGPHELSEDEIALISDLEGQDLDNDTMPEQILYECPERYYETLKAYFGKNFSSEMKAFLTGATLDLRVNIKKSPIEKVQNYLEADGVQTETTKYSPWGLRAKNKAFLSKTKAWHKGWIEIQDEGSQLIAYVCNAKPGMQVLDYCAGAGGKTLAIGSCMDNKGRIVASDNNLKRLEKGRKRIKKAGLHDIVEFRDLEDEKTRKWLKRQKGNFDIVLADVPCTGTGTWRRNPDMKWRIYGPNLEELLAVQSDIIQRCAKVVRKGGRLVYATCSLLPEENEKQIDTFLKSHEDFKVLPITEIWPEGDCPFKGPYLRLTPHQHGTDGFFAAVLERTS
jgi:16S rRNA (cytosine967-C5)-methyltransferase